MANPNMSALIVSSEFSQGGTYTGDSSMNINQPPPNQQSGVFSDGPVAIFWDIENCPVPSDVRPDDVAGNIRMALRVHPVIEGAVIAFSAYGDFNAFPRRLREGCQRTGVKLIDVPNGQKDAADKAILVDMFLFALDNPPPSSIMLISGDVDFAPALHILGQRRYTVILVIPSGVGVSSALCSAGKFVWDWPSVARGEGFMPPTKALIPPRLRPQGAGYLTGCHINDTQDCQNEEEAIVYRGISQSYYNSRDYSSMSQSSSEYNSTSLPVPYYPTSFRSHSLPSGLNKVCAVPVSCCDDQYDSTMCVLPGDLNGLKGQLVKLLELSGGCLPLTRVPCEYQKIYSRPLYVSEYGALKLVNLFKKMADTLAVEGKGNKKFVFLRNWKANLIFPPWVISKKDKKGKGTQIGTTEMATGPGSSDESSDEERVVTEELDEIRIQGNTNVPATRCEIDSKSLEEFKRELQVILVSYSYPIPLDYFEVIYQQRYKKALDYQRFHVDQLEELLMCSRELVALYNLSPLYVYTNLYLDNTLFRVFFNFNLAWIGRFKSKFTCHADESIFFYVLVTAF